MSFWPLPRILIEPMLAAAQGRPVWELGAGDGALAHRLRQVGLQVIELDRRRPSQVIADLQHLPVRPGHLAGAVFGNSIRHIDALDRPSVAAEVWAALRPGGAVLVLEDDPSDSRPASATYRLALSQLARIDSHRGAGLSTAQVTASVSSEWGEPAQVAVADNEEVVRDPMAPVKWLQSHQAKDVEQLADAVRRHGMQYGTFWGALFLKEAS